MSFNSGSSPTPFGIFDTDPDFASDADKIVNFTRLKLGDPIMHVHLSSSQVYASFEESVLEYSAIINQYQAKSVLSQFLGSQTGSLAGSEQTYPARLIEFQRKLAEPYGEAAGVGGTHTLHSGSINVINGQQKYDLQTLMTGALSSSAGDPNVRMLIKDIWHFSPLSAYRFFGTTSAVNYLNNQFSFESFTPETVFYLLPIWEDIMRGMQFKTSNKVRRSNYSFELHNNVLTLYPTPVQNNTLFFTYTLPPDPTAKTDSTNASHYGVSNMSNVPFGNVQYSKLNSLSKQWIRRYAFELAKETEGQIRSKMHSIPIPNGDLTLNGPELIQDARTEQQRLRDELKAILDETTYSKLIAQEAEMAENIQRTIRMTPLSIYIGSFWPFLLLSSFVLHELNDKLFGMS